MRFWPFNDTHRENTLLNKTGAVTKSLNMYIWEIILKLNFLKNEAASGKSPFNLSFDSQLCMEMLCFHSLFIELKNTTPAFQEEF